MNQYVIGYIYINDSNSELKLLVIQADSELDALLKTEIAEDINYYFPKEYDNKISSKEDFIECAEEIGHRINIKKIKN